jgi:nickel/cobalt transporter (NicO) family protein
MQPRKRIAMRRNRTLDIAWLAILALLAGTSAAAAQGFHHPFAVGADEGAVGSASGITAWIIGQESRFSLALVGAMRSAKASDYGFFALAGLSFLYGVFHAAGPGHGKAVITSYMISNERALKRGLIISVLAALLQGIVAVALVGGAVLIFNATAQRMNMAARYLEYAAYAGIILLGLVLLINKTTALAASIRHVLAARTLPVFAGSAPKLAYAQSETSGNFLADDGNGHRHGPDCGHFHAPDPRQLDADFSWKSAAVTVATAGARPCSGAILILVFSLAQEIFSAGIFSVFAMSLGTAITTGTLATLAVYAKKLAVRFSGRTSPRAEIIGRLIEVGAALCVLIFGSLLLLASFSGLTVA